MPGQDYENIERPYDANTLARSGDLTVTAGVDNTQQTDSQTGVSGGTAAYDPNADMQASLGGITPSSGGATQQATVPSAGAMDDVWIKNFVKSTNWSPKKTGFLIDGQTGYAEFANVYISGPIVAQSGTIGGFSIGSDYIRDLANSMGMASTVSGGDDVRFWAGDTYANRTTADFRVLESGSVTGSNINITGGSITGAGIVSVVALNLANRGWTQTCAFSVTDADTISWGAGSFVTADGGTTLSIGAGNTGNMAAKTYIYLDANVSLTAYQTTTTASTAVGASKVLIATAQNGTGEATFSVLSGQGGQNIDASNIVANSITANELSTSITYAGAIIIDTAGLIRSGQTAYDTGTGWWIGNSSGTPKLSIGNASGNKMTWDGSVMSIIGQVSSLNIRASTCFETAGRFSSTSTGTGSPSFDVSGLHVSTGTTATSSQNSQWFVTQDVFKGSPTFSCVLNMANIDVSNGSAGAFFGMGEPVISGSGLFNGSDNFAGFYLQKSSGVVTLYAVQNNATAITQSSSLTTVASSDVLDLIVKMNGTSSIDYYWRKNVGTLSSATNLATRVPTAASNKISLCTTNVGTAYEFSIIVISASYER